MAPLRESGQPGDRPKKPAGASLEGSDYSSFPPIVEGKKGQYLPETGQYSLQELLNASHDRPKLYDAGEELALSDAARSELVDLRNIAAKYEQLEVEFRSVNDLTSPLEVNRMLADASLDVGTLRRRLVLAATDLQRVDLPRVNGAINGLTDRVNEFEKRLHVLESDSKTRSIERTSLDYVAGSIVRITVCTYIVTLIGGPVLAWMLHSPVVAKMVDLCFGGMIASAAAEIGIAATRKIDG